MNLEAHDGEAVARLPERFIYTHRVVAVLCATMMFRLARTTAEGQWAFGLALIKESFAPFGAPST